MVAVGGAALFITVFRSYWLALSRGMPLIVAQTSAFTAWILGHILLAFVSRSAHDSVFSIGIVSNRVMLLWGAGAFLFLALALSFPVVGQRIGVTSISAGAIAVIVAIAIACMAGVEVAKRAVR